jgi:phosphate acyltransferase
MVKIGIDMLGGDHAPQAVVDGLRLFFAQNPTAHVVGFGPEAECQEAITAAGLNNTQVSLVHAPELIGMHEHPTKALREKPNSSITIGFGALKQQKIDALISAGNTGCMLVGSMFFLKPLPGVSRPAIPTILPKLDGSTGLLLDVGLNADCKPENLNEFAWLGSQYAKKVLGINNPKVALLNIGEEEGKGNLLAQATYPLLKENTHINFIGNVEGRDVLTGQADVILCDGFTGNVILKMAESLFDIAKNQNLNNPYFNRFYFGQYGGVPVLGVEKPVIIGHGISNGEAFCKMLELAQQLCNSQFADFGIPY